MGVHQITWEPDGVRNGQKLNIHYTGPAPTSLIIDWDGEEVSIAIGADGHGSIVVPMNTGSFIIHDPSGMAPSVGDIVQP